MTVRTVVMTASRIATLVAVVCAGCVNTADDPNSGDKSSELRPVVKTEDAASTGALRTADNPSEYVPFDTFVPPDEQKVLAAARTIIPRFSCQDMTLADALQQLSETAGVAIDIDRRALEEVGIDPSELRLTEELEGRDLRTVLRRLLEPIGLTWTINYGAIWVTTPEVADSRLITRVYDVVDLIQDGDAQVLVDQVQTLVAPITWDTNGGQGAIEIVNYGGIRAMVIGNTMDIHDEVSALLAALRRVRHHGLADEDIPDAVDPALAAEIQQRLMQSSAPDAPPADPARDVLVKNINQFALRLYAQLAKDHDGNLLFSPYSIATALGMIYGGASGETADEIAEAMQWTLSGDKLHAAFQSLDRVRWSAAGAEQGKFLAANRLWGQDGYAFKPAFTDTTLDYYAAKLARVDFNDPTEAARRINVWTSAQTAGLIPESVEPNDLDPMIRFVLANVVYFNYLWMDKFSEAATKPAEFFVAGKRVLVPTMTKKDKQCRYLQTGDGDNWLQILEKPYAGGNMALVVLLPNKKEGALARLEAGLDLKAIDDWNDALHEGEVDVHLPKFKYGQTIDLKVTLEKLGIRRAFDSMQADFSAVSDEESLYVGLARHKALVDVNEHGTEAAAASVLGGYFGGPPLFQANSPFLFYIIDKRTGCILLMGRVVDPRA